MAPKAGAGGSALGRYLDARILTRLMHLRLRPRGRVYGDLAGDHKSPLLGFAVEFGGHRGYVPGDDIKHIDWRVYYKVGKYYIKQYEAETNLIAHILLDCSESMTYGEDAFRKWEYAATLAATLSHLIIAKRDKVSLGLFDDKVVDFLSPSQSILQVREIDSRLADHVPREKTDMGRVLSDFATRCGRRRVIIIISDFFDEVDRIMHGVERLRYDNHDVIVFHVLHKDEMAFPFDGNIRFEGMEEMGDVKTDAQQVREAYRRVVEEYLEDFSRKCEKIGIEYVLMDTAVPVEVSLARLLSQRMGTAAGSRG
jgi:uncharacterized protein (DUF58 family)